MLWVVRCYVHTLSHPLIVQTFDYGTGLEIFCILFSYMHPSAFRLRYISVQAESYPIQFSVQDFGSFLFNEQ